jgi:hypothetical protein
LFLVNLCSVGAVGAGTRHFLSEQHSIDLSVDFEPIIHQWVADFYHFFAVYAEKQLSAIQSMQK